MIFEHTSSYNNIIIIDGLLLVDYVFISRIGIGKKKFLVGFEIMPSLLVDGTAGDLLGDYANNV